MPQTCSFCSSCFILQYKIVRRSRSAGVMSQFVWLTTSHPIPVGDPLSHTEICCSAQADWLLWTLSTVFLKPGSDLFLRAARLNTIPWPLHNHFLALYISFVLLCLCAATGFWQWPKCYTPLQLLLPPVLPFCYYWPGFIGITGWVAMSSNWLVTDSPNITAGL